MTQMEELGLYDLSFDPTSYDVVTKSFRISHHVALHYYDRYHVLPWILDTRESQHDSNRRSVIHEPELEK